MVRHIPYTLVVITILATTVAVTRMVGANADEGGSANDHETPATVKPIDPVISDLPSAVVETYQALFPGHRVWQTSQKGKGKEAEYELIIFYPNSPVVHGQLVDSVYVRTLVNYKLILNSTGDVIQEQTHPIAEAAVPKAAMLAFDKWKRPFPGRSLMVEWRAHQAEGAERLYSVQVVLNAVEGYGATFKADGTFVKRSTRFNKDRPRPPNK